MTIIKSRLKTYASTHKAEIVATAAITTSVTVIAYFTKKYTTTELLMVPTVEQLEHMLKTGNALIYETKYADVMLKIIPSSVRF